jgi:hypothetical protein
MREFTLEFLGILVGMVSRRWSIATGADCYLIRVGRQAAFASWSTFQSALVRDGAAIRILKMIGRFVRELDESIKELRAVFVHAQAVRSAKRSSGFYIASKDIASR